MTIGKGVKLLEISQEADSDLDDILNYGVVAHGVVAAETYVEGIDKAFEFLCRTPFAGQIDQETGLRLRRWKYRQHRIFYRVEGDCLGIVRVLHHSVDAQQQFR